MAKNTFFSSFKNAKNANFDRLAWTINCDVIIEHIRILIISSNSSLNSVSDRVLKHVPKMKNDQNMLIFPNQTNTILMNFSLLLFPIASGIVKFTSFSSDFKRFSTTFFNKQQLFDFSVLYTVLISATKKKPAAKKAAKKTPKKAAKPRSQQPRNQQPRNPQRKLSNTPRVFKETSSKVLEQQTSPQRMARKSQFVSNF